jgi:hypothetical protein
MEETNEPSQVVEPPQQTVDGSPIADVRRVRYECPECHHVEASFPPTAN